MQHLAVVTDFDKANKKGLTNYQAGRSAIRSGDVIGWKGHDIASRLIRWGGHDWSHVGVARVIGPRVLVFEARPDKGVVVSPLSKRLPCYHIPSGVQWSSLNDANAWDSIGEDYSYIDVLLTMLREVALKGGMDIGWLRTRMHGWHCSEYAAYVLSAEGRNTPDGVIQWAEDNYFRVNQEIA